jgi:hypothetical protein
VTAVQRRLDRECDRAQKRAVASGRMSLQISKSIRGAAGHAWQWPPLCMLQHPEREVATRLGGVGQAFQSPSQQGEDRTHTQAPPATGSTALASEQGAAPQIPGIQPFSVPGGGLPPHFTVDTGKQRQLAGVGGQCPGSLCPLLRAGGMEPPVHTAQGSQVLWEGAPAHPEGSGWGRWPEATGRARKHRGSSLRPRNAVPLLGRASRQHCRCRHGPVICFQPRKAQTAISGFPRGLWPEMLTDSATGRRPGSMVLEQIPEPQWPAEAEEQCAGWLVAHSWHALLANSGHQ